MARHRRVLGMRRVDRGVDPARALAQVAERARGAGPARRGGGGVAVDHVPGREAVGDLRAAVDLPQHDRDLGDHVRLAEVRAPERAPGDERGDQALGVAQERHDLGPDAGGGRRRGRLALAVAVDPQQRGVLARQPHHEVAPAVAHAQVVVGDAAAEHLRLALGRAEHVVERRAAGGRRRVTSRRCSRAHPYHGAGVPARRPRRAAAAGRRAVIGLTSPERRPRDPRPDGRRDVRAAQRA